MGLFKQHRNRREELVAQAINRAVSTVELYELLSRESTGGLTDTEEQRLKKLRKDLVWRDF